MILVANGYTTSKLDWKAGKTASVIGCLWIAPQLEPTSLAVTLAVNDRIFYFIPESPSSCS